MSDRVTRVPWTHTVTAAIVVRMEDEGMPIPSFVQHPRELRKIHERQLPARLFARVLCDKNPIPISVVSRLSDCPLSVQKKAARHGVPFVTASGETMQVPLNKVKCGMIPKIFGHKCILTEEEQAANSKNQTNEESDTPYEVFVNEGAVVFTRPCRITLAQLTFIVSQFRGKR